MVYSAALVWNALEIYQKSIWSSLSSSAIVSLLIFCLKYLSIDVTGVLKFPTTIVLLSVYYFMLIRICFMYLSAPTLGA